VNLLLALRIRGPITLAKLADKLGLTEVQLDWRLWELEGKGLAAHPTSSSGTWSVTELGRRCVDHHEVPEVSAVRRDGARACVGRAG
jgi:hypothetical protein